MLDGFNSSRSRRCGMNASIEFLAKGHPCSWGNSGRTGGMNDQGGPYCARCPLQRLINPAPKRNPVASCSAWQENGS